MRRISPTDLSIAGLIAALYAVLTVGFWPISFGVYQVRVAEALTVLPFITRAAIPGLYIGCLLANIFGGMGWLDIVFGSLITLTAAVLTRGAKLIPGGAFSRLLALLPVLLTWASATYLLLTANGTFALVVAIVLVAAALILSLLLGRAFLRGTDLRVFLAPLPPVILNAFGVSIYLAPLLGFNYWFSVQMIGVGELIACYLLGLPLLLALRKRSLPE